jgi:hypothetical protein
LLGLHSRKTLSLLLLSLLLLSGLAALPAARANGGDGVGVQTTERLTSRGTTTLSSGSSAAAEFNQNSQHDQVQKIPSDEIPRSSKLSTSVSASLTIPSPAGIPIAGSNPGESGFAGLNHRDQRLAGTGSYTNTQFSLEPPDQGPLMGTGRCWNPSTRPLQFMIRAETS